MISLAITALLAGLGGYTFDFRAISERRFPADDSGVNLATNEWKHGTFVHLGASALAESERSRLNRAIEAATEYREADGVFGMEKTPRVLEICTNNWTILSATSSGYSQKIALPDDKGGTYRISLKYRTCYRVRRGGSDLQVYDARGPKQTYPYIWHLPDSDLEWNRYVREFEVAPGTKAFTVYMRSYGYGKLAFKDLCAVKVPPKPAAEHPIEIVNTPHGLLDHTFAVSRNQPGLLHYQWRTLDGVKRERSRFTFILTVPKGFGLVDILFADEKGWSETEKPDGSRDYRFTSACEAPAARFNDWFRFGVMVDTAAEVGTTGELTLSAEYDGKPITNVDRMRLFVVPEIKVAAPSPEFYMNGFHQASAAGFVSRHSEVNERYGRFMYDCGVRLAKCSRSLLGTYRAVGIPRVIVETKIANGFQIGFAEKAPADEKYVAKDPNFRSAKNSVCPVSVYQEKPFFTTNTLPYLAENLKGTDGIWANWEPYSFAEQGCMCDDCCREYAKFLGLPYEDVKTDWPACIARTGRLGKDAIRFRSWQHGELMKTLHRHVVELTGGTRSMGFCAGVEHGQMMSNWREVHLFPEVEVKDYGNEFRWLDPWGPYSGVWDTDAPYVRSPGYDMLDFFNALDIRASADRDWPDVKLMAMPHGFQCGTCVIQPELVEMNLDAYFFAGWDASVVYFFPLGYDARYWRAFANATAKAAKYEGCVKGGRRIDGLVRLWMSPDFPPPIRTAHPALWASGARFPNFRDPLLLQTIAWEGRDGTRLVAAFNFREDGPAEFDLSFSDRGDTHRLSVPASRCVVFEFNK